MSEIDVYKEWLGIPAGTRPPDHYTLLRLVQFEDDIEKIRNNYRISMRMCGSIPRDSICSDPRNCSMKWQRRCSA